MTELLEFLKALLRHYVGWITSSLVAAVIMVIERVRGKPFSWPIYAVTLILGFGFSFFQAWQEQYRAATAARQSQRTLEIRNQLARLLEEGNAIKQLCHSEQPVPLENAEKWSHHVEEYLEKNLERSYKARFTGATGDWLGIIGAPEHNNNIWNFVNWRTEVLTQFIRELKT